VIREVKPESTHVVYCDAEVSKVETFDRDELIEFKPEGGGGTDFRPVFDWVEKEGIEPACLIYFTDLDGTFPDKEPEYPVLWVSVGRAEAPFGETLQLSGKGGITD
jgi:predicted metal-dependent peptidase